MESINNAITNGQTNGVVVSGPVGSASAGVVTAGSGVGQGTYGSYIFTDTNVQVIVI